MKFSEERKQAIRAYILEKIAQKAPSVSQAVAEALEVDPSTVHTYLNELAEEGIIRRVKRGEYELVSREFIYELSRSAGDLEDDIRVYERCLREHLAGFESNVQNIWSYAFSEMINNAMDHSMAENVRVTVSQDYTATRVTISDDGVGIFEKIRDYFHFETLDEAICELFKGKLTTDSVNHSGEGIFFSSKLMDSFYIVSSGKIFTSSKFGDSRIVDLALANEKGTTVIMELSNHTRKAAHEVFDAYASVDGGFTKTRIPMKQLFDSSPVSRSQAKRVCNRLEQFRGVIVDFDGIDWIGQGFAHQMFVVFANSHPQIEITPVNMNESVENMYRHVTGPETLA